MTCEGWWVVAVVMPRQRDNAETRPSRPATGVNVSSLTGMLSKLSIRPSGCVGTIRAAGPYLTPAAPEITGQLHGLARRACDSAPQTADSQESR
jgi:hypothetical protein